MSEFERQIYTDLKSTDRVSLWVAKCMELAEFSCILTDEDIDGNCYGIQNDAKEG